MFRTTFYVIIFTKPEDFKISGMLRNVH